VWAGVTADKQGDEGSTVHSDYDMIRELYARYSVAADNVDADAYGGCFTEDGEFLFVNEGIRNVGRDTMTSAIVKSSRRGYHVNVDLLVQIHGSAATATSRLFEFERETGVLFRMGNYNDVLRKENGRWYFASRRLVYEKGSVLA
jgi:hypothetical protein